MNDLLTLKDWAEIYKDETGKVLNMGTLRKRRAMSGLGMLVPPRTYLLTRAEFDTVLATPLPMCNQVVSA